MLESFTKTTFDPLLKSKFRLRSDSGDAPETDLTLVETEEKPTPGLESFTLTFQGPHGLPRQGTFRLEHPSLGTFDIFLTSVRADEKGTYFQAVFSRIKPRETGG